MTINYHLTIKPLTFIVSLRASFSEIAETRGGLCKVWGRVFTCVYPLYMFARINVVKCVTLNIGAAGRGNSNEGNGKAW